MAKRSHKRPSRHGRDTTGCVSSLLNVFDFRHGRNTRRLLPERVALIKQTSGHSRDNGTVAVCGVETCDSLEDSIEKEKAKISVKELMEEEMVNEESMVNNSRVVAGEITSNFEAGKDGFGLNSVSELDATKCLLEKLGAIADLKTSDKLVPEKVMEHLAQIRADCSLKDDFIDELRVQEDTKEEGSPFCEEISSHRPRNFSRRRSRYLESFLQVGNEECSSSLAVMKPRQSFETDGAVSSTSFRFSFTEIKRKLWHALGKERTVISSVHRNRKNNGRQSHRDNLGWSSPNRNHFFNERFILNDEQHLKLKECQGLGGGFNIYIEAKKHISEMLKDEDEDSVVKQLPKSLGMILDVPPYSASPCCSHADDDKDGPLLEVQSSQVEDLKRLPSVIEENGEAAESRPEEEDGGGEIINISTEHGGTREAGDEDGFYQLLESSSTCLQPDFNGEEQMFSSTSNSPITSCEQSMDKLEQPSPVSVLDPLFMDDASSPASTSSEPGVMAEEQTPACDHTMISLEDEESPFEYVEAILLGSGLDWNEFHLRWLASHDILDTSIFDEVEAFSNRSRHDQRLLFDCANEALKGLCDTLFGSFRANTNMHPIPRSVDLILEIWRHVEWHLFQQMQVNSADRLVQIDLARSGKWMRLQRDAELIVVELEVDILDEVMEDAILDQ